MKNTLILQLGMAKSALHQNLAGLSHAESLVSPEKGGNCMNWLVGHLNTAYSNLLQAVGEEAACDSEQMAPYERGCGPLDPARAQPFEALLADFDRCHARVVAKLGNLTEEELAAPASFSPRNDPNETIGSLLALVAFHQAYHVGQTGVLRRVVGRAGAIA